jgi:hypothetical protein
MKTRTPFAVDPTARLPDADWIRYAAIAQRLLWDHPEDARAFVVMRIPELAAVNDTVPKMRQAMKREVSRWHRTDRKCGLTMRNTADVPPFTFLDETIPGSDSTWHDVVPGHASPEDWLSAVEQVTLRLTATA